MRRGTAIAPVVLLALGLACGSAQAADSEPPAVSMRTPSRIGAARFVVLRVADAATATLAVNGTRVDAGDVAARGRVRVRARFGWEPGRRYRIRMTAADSAGNVRSFRASIRARNFGIHPLAIRNLTRARAPVVHSAGGCGYVHLRPRHIRPGRAPLALRDSVMLGAAWRLTRAGFETDTLCGRSPRAGVGVLRRRRARGTLPEVVVVALGSNLPMTSRDIRALLRVLGPRRRLMLVTQMRHRRAVSGAPMRRAARRHPRRVGLIDWSELARRHSGWLWGDGTHLRPSGLPGYTR